MAENLKIWRNNRWFGGFSEDRHLGIDGSFWRAAGVEVRKFPRELRLSKAISTQSPSVVQGAPQAGSVTTNGDTIVGSGVCAGASTEQGKVYRRAKGTQAWAHVYTFSGNPPILDIKEYNGFLYFTTASALHRIQIADTKTDVTWTTMTVAYQSLNSSYVAHPMFEAFNNLYVGNGYCVAMLSPASVWTAAKLQLDSYDEVCRTTFVGSMLRFWCRKTFDTSASYQRDEGAVVLWNGTSDAYTERVPLSGMFQTCATLDGLDYFIAGFTPALYVLNGLTPMRLKVIPNRSGSTEHDLIARQSRFFPNAMVAHRGVLYFGTPTDNADIETGIWSYGRLNEAFPFSMNLDYVLTGDDVSLVMVGDDNMLIAGLSNSTIHRLYWENYTQYGTTGEAETRVFGGSDCWAIKDSVKLSIGFRPLNYGDKIEVYVRTDFGSYGASPVLTAQYSDTADRVVNYKHMLLPFTGKEFNHVQFKVKLTSDGSSYTPCLCDFALVFEDVKAP